MHHVCTFYDIPLDALIQAKRHVLNLPRLVCIYICRKQFGLTLRIIANSFNNISHVTVSTAIQKCEYRLQKEPGLRQEVDAIYHSIRNDILKNHR